MKVLVIGSGGREHAMAWKLAQSPHVTRMWVAPGNAGITEEHCNSELVRCVSIEADDIATLLKFAENEKIDLTVVGPDNPLALGIVDQFQKRGLRIWGPNQRAAQFESSKVFSQTFMDSYGIPTAKAGTFSDAVAAKKFAASLGARCVVKADGLALGKGVILCRSQREAEEAIDGMMVKRAFGGAGTRVVIQEFLEGMEISLHALCDGRTVKLFPTAQDHKQVFNGDRGPNTGGMGAYSPTPFLSDAQIAAAEAAIISPWLKGCLEEGIDFRGILYPGIMLTKSGAKVLEFNARFGDPETQVYLTRLESDLFELLQASVDGTLNKVPIRWKEIASVCVVMASAGYPGSYARGKTVTGLDEVGKLPNTKVFHAGTRREGQDFVTSGGRVLGVTAWAEDLTHAQAAAYRAVEQIKFDGAHCRRDIAAKGLGKSVST